MGCIIITITIIITIIILIKNKTDNLKFGSALWCSM